MASIGGRISVVMLTKDEVRQLAREAALDAVSQVEALRSRSVGRRPASRWKIFGWAFLIGVNGVAAAIPPWHVMTPLGVALAVAFAVLLGYEFERSPERLTTRRLG